MIDQQQMLGEDRQGEVLEMTQGNRPEKLFYIESYGHP